MAYFHKSVAQKNGQVIICNDVTSKKIEEKLKLPDRPTSKVVCAIGVDLETSSSNPLECEIIEIAIREFFFDPETKKIIGVRRSYQSYQEPSQPIDPIITEITGIRNGDVKGQSIDWDQVNDLFNKASVIVAHNASFERTILERQEDFIKRKKIWACSLNMISWPRDFGSKSLENLLLRHGVGFAAHRALIDTDVMIYLLSLDTYFKEMVENAKKEEIMILAYNTDPGAFDTLRDELGYRWYNDKKSKEKYLHKTVSKDELELEKRKLKEIAYQKRSSRNARYIPVDMFNKGKHQSEYSKTKVKK